MHWLGYSQSLPCFGNTHSLIGSRVEAKFISTMFHALHFIIKNVRLQQLMIALYPPPEVGGFTATEDKTLNLRIYTTLP